MPREYFEKLFRKYIDEHFTAEQRKLIEESWDEVMDFIFEESIYNLWM